MDNSVFNFIKSIPILNNLLDWAERERNREERQSEIVDELNSEEVYDLSENRNSDLGASLSNSENSSSIINVNTTGNSKSSSDFGSTVNPGIEAGTENIANNNPVMESNSPHPDSESFARKNINFGESCDNSVLDLSASTNKSGSWNTRSSGSGISQPHNNTGSEYTESISPYTIPTALNSMAPDSISSGSTSTGGLGFSEPKTSSAHMSRRPKLPQYDSKPQLQKGDMTPPSKVLATNTKSDSSPSDNINVADSVDSNMTNKKNSNPSIVVTNDESSGGSSVSISSISNSSGGSSVSDSFGGSAKANCDYFKSPLNPLESPSKVVEESSNHLQCDDDVCRSQSAPVLSASTAEENEMKYHIPSKDSITNMSKISPLLNKRKLMNDHGNTHNKMRKNSSFLRQNDTDSRYSLEKHGPDSLLSKSSEEINPDISTGDSHLTIDSNSTQAGSLLGNQGHTQLEASSDTNSQTIDLDNFEESNDGGLSVEAGAAIENFDAYPASPSSYEVSESPANLYQSMLTIDSQLSTSDQSSASIPIGLNQNLSTENNSEASSSNTALHANSSTAAPVNEDSAYTFASTANEDNRYFRRESQIASSLMTNRSIQPTDSVNPSAINRNSEYPVTGFVLHSNAGSAIISLPNSASTTTRVGENTSSTTATNTSNTTTSNTSTTTTTDTSANDNTGLPPLSNSQSGRSILQESNFSLPTGPESEEARAIIITVNYVFSDENDPMNPNRSGSLVLSLPNSASNRDPDLIQQLIRFATQMAYSSIISGLHKEKGVTKALFDSFPQVDKSTLDLKSCVICFEEFSDFNPSEPGSDIELLQDTKRRKVEVNEAAPESVPGTSSTSTTETDSTITPDSKVYLSSCEPTHDHTSIELPCHHVFGKCCLQEWLKDNTSCPLCRKALVTPADNHGHTHTARNLSMFILPHGSSVTNDYSNTTQSLRRVLRSGLGVQDENDDTAASTTPRSDSGPLSHILGYLRRQRRSGSIEETTTNNESTTNNENATNNDSNDNYAIDTQNATNSEELNPDEFLTFDDDNQNGEPEI